QLSMDGSTEYVNRVHYVRGFLRDRGPYILGQPGRLFFCKAYCSWARRTSTMSALGPALAHDDPSPIGSVSTANYPCLVHVGTSTGAYRVGCSARPCSEN